MERYLSFFRGMFRLASSTEKKHPYSNTLLRLDETDIIENYQLVEDVTGSRSYNALRSIQRLCRVQSLTAPDYSDIYIDFLLTNVARVSDEPPFTHVARIKFETVHHCNLDGVGIIPNQLESIAFDVVEVGWLDRVIAVCDYERGGFLIRCDRVSVVFVLETQEYWQQGFGGP